MFKNYSHMDTHAFLFEQTIIEECNTKSVFEKVVSCWLGPIFLCSCAKFGEFDSNSESPKRCNGVFKESSQWPPAVLKLIPTSSQKKKRNTILCHSIAKTNKKKNKLIFTSNKKKTLQKSHFRLNSHCDASFLFVGTVKNTNTYILC